MFLQKIEGLYPVKAKHVNNSVILASLWYYVFINILNLFYVS